MESCFLSQRIVSFYFFPINLALQAQENLYACACERMCLCVCVLFVSFCDVTEDSSDGCLFGLLSLYLLSSSGRREENPLVPCMCV